MCDCEVPQAFNERWRTARKPHRCCECGAWIKPGDRYNYVSGIWDNQPDSHHTCVECVQVRDWIVSQSTRWDCEPCFTQLYDDMPRADWPPHLVEAQAVLREELARKAA
ncbi:hypothetical protein [Novosphingobium sp. BW1]|uniref:hypothetical protein n=1 Tax=Novosphingobium sp. BW1 TaxID=2592621 RepID=UPI0011DE63BB|nr:hypothetical protein [Novosphingobium sp. BW1]TYC93010.1 hypothetical protein FMM79_03210 [Novosphingobium sp. BW1]